MSLRILHVTPAYFPATYWGGPIFTVYSLNNALASFCDVQLRVLTSDTAGPLLSNRLPVSTYKPTKYPHGYDVHFCRRVLHSEIAPAMLWRLVTLVRWADVVHLTATYSFSTIPTLLVCRLMRKPVVWSPRGALQATHEWAGARLRSQKAIWERICDFIVKGRRCVLHVTSAQEREASLARIPHAYAQIIKNGVDVPDQLPPRVWCPDGKLRLMFIGRLDPKKGLENLLYSLVLLRESNISLRIFGTGSPEYVADLEALVESLRISDLVTFAGHVDGEDRLAAFMCADLVIAPSHSENFCMVVAEALAHGVPVIASKGTPWAEIVDRGCGNWIENDPRSLATAISQVRECALEEMGQAGRQWMQADFSWRTIASEMHNLYKAITVSQPQAE